MIIKANKENQNSIIHLIPDELVHLLAYNNTLCLFNLNAESELVSLVLAQLNNTHFDLLWIYTVQNERRKGYALQLIERLKLIAVQMGDVDAVSASLPCENLSLPFFVKSSFNIPETPDIEYTTTVKKLSRESLWRRALSTDNIMLLEKVPTSMFADFESIVIRQENPGCLPFPLQKAEYMADLSFGYVKDNELIGVLIIEKDDTNGLVLAGIHVTQNGQVAQSLIYACGKKIIELYPLETKIHIIAINNASKRLIDKLLTAKEERFAYRLLQNIN